MRERSITGTIVGGMLLGLVSAAVLVGVDDPWGWGRSLEWATSSPPPRHNFVLSRIRSESPAFDLKHPELAIDEYRASGAPRDNLLDADEDDGGTARLARQQVLDTTKTADEPTD